MGESLTGHIKTADNPADLAMKIIDNGEKQQHLVNMLLFDIFDEHDHADKQQESKASINSPAQ